MGVGVDAVWGFELELNSPYPEPAPARGDSSFKRGRERESLPWDIELNRVTARGRV